MQSVKGKFDDKGSQSHARGSAPLEPQRLNQVNGPEESGRSSRAQASEVRGLLAGQVQKKPSKTAKAKKSKETEKWTFSSGEMKETFTKGQPVTLSAFSPVLVKGGGMKLLSEYLKGKSGVVSATVVHPAIEVKKGAQRTCELKIDGLKGSQKFYVEPRFLTLATSDAKKNAKATGDVRSDYVGSYISPIDPAQVSKSAANVFTARAKHTFLGGTLAKIVKLVAAGTPIDEHGVKLSAKPFDRFLVQLTDGDGKGKYRAVKVTAPHIRVVPPAIAATLFKNEAFDWNKLLKTLLSEVGSIGKDMALDLVKTPEHFFKRMWAGTKGWNAAVDTAIENDRLVASLRHVASPAKTAKASLYAVKALVTYLVWESVQTTDSSHQTFVNSTKQAAKFGAKKGAKKVADKAAKKAAKKVSDKVTKEVLERVLQKLEKTVLKAVVTKAAAFGATLAATFATGATGLGIPMFFIKIVALCDKVAGPSRWLKDNHPSLHASLKKSDHDFLFFLIKDDFDEVRETVMVALREAESR